MICPPLGTGNISDRGPDSILGPCSIRVQLDAWPPPLDEVNWTEFEFSRLEAALVEKTHECEIAWRHAEEEIILARNRCRCDPLLVQRSRVTRRCQPRKAPP
jgi:hypothetical protein